MSGLHGWVDAADGRTPQRKGAATLTDERFARNLGLIDAAQQQALAAAHVAVCGCGGMGGVCVEVLARMGVGALTLVDHDHFERSNINRQIHSGESTLGRKKVEVLANVVRDINPAADVRTYPEGVTVDNVRDIVTPADVLVNGMDQMRVSLILERSARELGKPIVDAWLTPYASVFVMQPESPHWEQFLDLPTQGVALADLDEDLCRAAMVKEVEYTFSCGEPYKYVERELVQEVIRGQRPRPSLAPVVWLSGVLMANEVFKHIVGYKTTDHVGIVYDQYTHRIYRLSDSD